MGRSFKIGIFCRKLTRAPGRVSGLSKVLEEAQATKLPWRIFEVVQAVPGVLGSESESIVFIGM